MGEFPRKSDGRGVFTVEFKRGVVQQLLKGEKTLAHLSSELGSRSLAATLKIADFDADKVKADLRAKARDVRGVLERQIPPARQMLRKLLADKIEIEPIGSGRRRAFKFRGALTIDRLIGGEEFVTATNNTSVSGGPNGMRALVGHLSFWLWGQALRDLTRYLVGRLAR